MASRVRENGSQDKEALRITYPTIALGTSAVSARGTPSERAPAPALRVPRPPPSASARTSAVMRANRATSTGPEIALRSALWASGARGFRVNYQGIPGRPDIVFPTKNLAVFVNGCFWHRCPRHARSLPKSHSDYWRLKFELNRLRDERKVKELQSMGWTILVVWECELRTNEKVCVARIRRFAGFAKPCRPAGTQKAYRLGAITSRCPRKCPGSVPPPLGTSSAGPGASRKGSLRPGSG